MNLCEQSSFVSLLLTLTTNSLSLTLLSLSLFSPSLIHFRVSPHHKFTVADNDQIVPLFPYGGYSVYVSVFVYVCIKHMCIVHEGSVVL